MQDPFEKFSDWYAKANDSEDLADAVALATSDSRGYPSVRMVLLKGHGPDGFTFYTNMESRKGQEILGNMRAALCFHWKSLTRQVRIEGPLQQVSDEEADAYYDSRARDSRIGAWASKQSRPMEGRFEFEAAIAKYAAKYAVGHIPRPPYWTGFRLCPEAIEFWEERKFRLHDRTRYRREGAGDWVVEKLYP
ncbi:pyridoxamine 5'-phosphate oxidase [Emcibacter nanhaiensis]|uniref:Pyridoxine/pyridoxamine 5'-phosphate oxidase n=1 Tax=Emcibacter nanhaiensis TaxID=1505037 RepID=A0A501PAV7_9PROT|nr:pyridoxamine 5'-phosphate oxidase [Emcibacter nanhaiensis]TPD57500.1 pyridoxamine 5'-phosphate oxidase [Emcibacter nanhaiensis]